jgi:hypothetical protein
MGSLHHSGGGSLFAANAEPRHRAAEGAIRRAPEEGDGEVVAFRPSRMVLMLCVKPIRA